MICNTYQLTLNIYERYLVTFCERCDEEDWEADW